MQDVPGFALDLDHSQETLRKQAEALKGFGVSLGSRGQNVWQLTVRVELATERPSDTRPEWVRRGLGLSGELQSLDRQRRYVAEIMKVTEGPSTQGSKALVASTVKALMERINQSIRLNEANLGVLEQTLKEGDDHDRAEVVRVAQERKLTALVPALVVRLQQKRMTLQEAVRLSSALTALGAKEAVGPIIDTISRFPRATIPLLFLLGRLGGKEAEAYLFTVQSGHPNPKVQAAAREVLAENHGSDRLN